MKKGDKVLARSWYFSGYWQAKFFVRDNLCSDIPGGHPVRYQEIIPYEGNEHLLFTNDPAPKRPKPGEWWLCCIDGHAEYSFREYVLYFDGTYWRRHDEAGANVYTSERVTIIPIRKIA